jgi:hypothetical protein
MEQEKINIDCVKKNDGKINFGEINLIQRKK